MSKLTKWKEWQKAFFDYIADYYEQKIRLEDRDLTHHWDEAEFQVALELANVKKGDCVLDMGAGTGIFTIRWAKVGANVIGVDFSKCMLKLAREKIIKEIIAGSTSLVLADSEHLPFQENTFNSVIGWGLLHHVGNIPNVVREMVRVVKIGRRIVTIDPNALNVWWYIRMFANRHWDIERGIARCTRWGLKKIFEQSGLHKIEMREFLFTLKHLPPCMVRVNMLFEDALMRVPIINHLAALLAVKGEKM